MTSACAGLLRIEEVDAGLMLPQILKLRSAVGRTVSLSPDPTPWRDPLDMRAMHWGVFREAELVGAARLCVHASAERVLDSVPLRSLGDDPHGPVAVMSHCVVRPCLRDLRLGVALDAARLERARQLRLPLVVAMAESPRRAAVLGGHGFEPLPVSAGMPHALAIRLAQPSADVIRLPVRSRR